MSNPRRAGIGVDWLALWILFSAWCAISGWGLSLLGCLNRAGVCASSLFFVGIIFLLWQPLQLSEPSGLRPWPWLRRRRVLPRVWLVLTGLVLIGGLAYTPNNYDYLTYRFPRLLFWSWEQKWFWISTANPRMNYSGTQFEWMMAPSFILFQTDRFFFLINFVSYLFFPGLIFSVFRGFGISGRVSWWWMWVLPCGACYILQAASVGNDSFAAIYLLAAFHFLLRTKQSSLVKSFVLSTLAIALLSGAKASNLPLALPWAILLFLNRAPYLERVKPQVAAAVLVVAASVSFLPLAILNHAYTGDLFGDPFNGSHMKVSNPLAGVVGNALEIGSDNLAPPFWYKEISWNPEFPAPLAALLQRDFPRLGMGGREFPVEEGAGVGFGCVLAALLFLGVAAGARGFDRRLVIVRSRPGVWMSWATVIAALVYMSKIASEAAPRLVAPYYVLAVAGVAVLASLDGSVVRWRLFRWAGLVAMLCAVPAVILSPTRPLFPIQATADFLGHYGSAEMRQRFEEVYTVYAQRAFSFAQVTALIPISEKRIGFIQNSNAVEASLWRPFGSHRVVEVSAGDSAEQIKARGVRWLVVSQDAIVAHAHTDIAALLTKWSGRLVAERYFAMTVHQGAETWYVIDLGGA